MTPSITEILQNWNTVSEALLRQVWLPLLYDATKDLPRRGYLMSRLRRSSEGLQGLKVYLAFQTKGSRGWRPVSRLGYLPSGSPLAGDQMSFQLGCHMAGIQVTYEDLVAFSDDNSRIGPLLEAHLKGIMEAAPDYVRNLVWLPESGIIGVVASITGTTVTLDNDGLEHTHALDLNRYFIRGEYVQTYTSAGVPRGKPVEVVWVDPELATIHLAANPTNEAGQGIQDGDFFVASDIAGLETAYNQFGPGVFDVMADDNTFQGIDRAQIANAWARAWVYDNGGTAQAPTYEILSQFLRKAGNPDYALTGWHLIDAYYRNEIRDDVRFTPGRQYVDGFETVTVNKTRLVQDDDCLNDRILVPDFANMWLADMGGIQDLMQQGLKQVEGRPLFERHFCFWARLVAARCNQMAMRVDLDPAAALA